MNLNLTEIEIEIEAYENYLHVGSFFVLLIIFAVYLWFVLVAGPEFMAKRQPFNVTPLVRLYNVFQVIVCTIYVTRSYQLGFTFHYLFKCERFEFLDVQDRLEIKIGSWLFLSLRVFEFMETIFFVLRKKQKQASFLHIFHHIGSVMMTWLFIVWKAELMAVYIATINSSVHIVMYSYYFWSSFKNKKIQRVIRPVKPLITMLQLSQFMIIIAHCTVAILPKCHASYFFHIQIFNFVILTFLFGKFFIESYMKSDKKRDVVIY